MKVMYVYLLLYLFMGFRNIALIFQVIHFLKFVSFLLEDLSVA